MKGLKVELTKMDEKYGTIGTIRDHNNRIVVRIYDHTIFFDDAYVGMLTITDLEEIIEHQKSFHKHLEELHLT